MSATAAWVCDGPDCNEMIPRKPGERFPADWPRVRVDGGVEEAGGSFHSKECAVRWTARELRAELPLAEDPHAKH